MCDMVRSFRGKSPFRARRAGESDRMRVAHDVRYSFSSAMDRDPTVIR